MAEILDLQQTDDVLNMGVEVYLRAREVRALTKPGQGWRMDFMACCPQSRGNAPPCPAPGPSPSDQHERRQAIIHEFSSSRRNHGHR